MFLLQVSKKGTQLKPDGEKKAMNNIAWTINPDKCGKVSEVVLRNFSPATAAGS